MKTKYCASCKLTRSTSDFYKNRGRLDGLTSKCWECHNAEAKRTKTLRRAQAIEKLGGKCCRCGFTDIRALQFDHVHGGGRKDIQSTYPMAHLNDVLKDTSGKFQLLCANCNWIKRHENGEHGQGNKSRILGDAVPVRDIAPPGVNMKKWWASLTGEERSQMSRKQQTNRKFSHTPESKANLSLKRKSWWASKTPEERSAIMKERQAKRRGSGK
jgi:hypothetical protein